MITGCSSVAAVEGGWLGRRGGWGGRSPQPRSSAASWTLSGAPPASGRVVQDRNSQVSAMLGPPDDALSEVALGEQHPSGGEGVARALLGSHPGVVCTARPQEAGPAVGAGL